MKLHQCENCLRTGAILLFACLLGGCIPSGPATRLYLLTPESDFPDQGVAESARPIKFLNVLIRDVRLPLYLDRPEIVTRDEGNGLVIAEAEHWGGRLREDLARVLAMNLGRRLVGDRVAIAPVPALWTPDVRVDLEIMSFERQPDGRVRLVAQWWLSRGRDGALLASFEKTLWDDPLVGDVPHDAIVGSMSRVYGVLCRQIAFSIRPGLSSAP